MCKNVINKSRKLFVLKISQKYELFQKWFQPSVQACLCLLQKVETDVDFSSTRCGPCLEVSPDTSSPALPSTQLKCKSAFFSPGPKLIFELLQWFEQKPLAPKSKICYWLLAAKGQLISKGNFAVPKNKLENFNFCPSLLGQTFFVRFMKEFKKPKVLSNLTDL